MRTTNSHILISDTKACASRVRLPRARVEALAAGDWLDGGGNLIAIGNSGTGKTHILCVIGHALIEQGRRVYYTRTSDLVQRLQAARRHFVLEAALAKLDRFELIILDDITCAHKDQAETGVLFELIARRHEYRSIAIAANQPFSGRDQIFPDKAMTVAAIDRLVHHATILAMNAESYRQRAAASNRKVQAEMPPTTIADNQNEGAIQPKTQNNTPTPAASKPAKMVIARRQSG
ncbi:MAG: ATP-binding protein [Rhodobacterales bacterium]|nr:ATP-binding protein [Rhodobacterales bacterium]